MIARIVIITDDAIESGGAAVIALSSARLLAQRGIRVSVLAGHGNIAAGLNEYGVCSHDLGGKHILEGSRSNAAVFGLYNSRTRANLDRWINEFDSVDTIYHVHNWHKILTPSVFYALRRVQHRVVFSAHDYFVVCPNGGYFHFQKGKVCDLVPMKTNCLLANCDKRNYAHKLWRVARQLVLSTGWDLSNAQIKILAVHEGMVPHLVRGGVCEENIYVLRNPAEAWCDSRVTAEANSDILFVGRLEIDKGVIELAEAARTLGLRVTVIGEGPLRSALSRDFPEVKLLGYKTRPELGALARKARILVMPSRVRETFGLVALEALLSGVPVVVSRLAPIAREIEARGMGFGFEPGDLAGLALAITKLNSDNSLVASMSKRAVHEARALAPTPEKWCDQLLDFYERLVTEQHLSAS